MQRTGFSWSSMSATIEISIEICRRPASPSFVFIPPLSVDTFLLIITFTVHYLISSSDLPLSSHLLLISPLYIPLSTSHLSASFSDWPFPQNFQSCFSSVPGCPYFQSPVSNRREEGEMSDKTTIRWELARSFFWQILSVSWALQSCNSSSCVNMGSLTAVLTASK